MPTRVTSCWPRRMPEATSTSPQPANAAPRVVRERRSWSHGTSAGGSGDPDALQEVADDVRGRATSHLRLAGGDEPVREHGHGHLLHVVGEDVVAPGQGRVGARGAQQVQRGAR